MGNRFKGKVCYYCGDPAVSTEHGPAQQMFKGFTNDSITALSCKKHNEDKNDHDDAIIKAMLISLHQTAPLKAKRSAKVIQAIQTAAPHFDQVKQVVQTHRLLSDAPPNLDVDLAYLDPSINIFAWMRMLTAVLVYNVTQRYDPAIEWDKADAWSASWDHTTRITRPTEQVGIIYAAKRSREDDLERWTWIPGWPSGRDNYPPAIYNFKLYFHPKLVYFRHRFFDAYNWYVKFQVSPEVSAALIQRVGAKAA